MFQPRDVSGGSSFLRDPKDLNKQFSGVSAIGCRCLRKYLSVLVRVKRRVFLGTSTTYVGKESTELPLLYFILTERIGSHLRLFATHQTGFVHEG